MKFGSDNWAGASDQISQALHDARGGFTHAYGDDKITTLATQRLKDAFECDLDAWFVSTGTAANSLLLASVSKPGGVIFAHEEAHINVDEAQAPEFFSGGAKIHGLKGALGKISPNSLDAAIKKFPADFIHHGQPVAVSITQPTEIGTLYSLDEIKALSDVAHAHGLPMHMDGARFANALVSLGVTAGDMTWRAGVDLLSFGGTKNGCWCAEAAILFNADHSRDFLFHRKRAGHLFSKSRFVSAQFAAYVKDGHWLDLARHSNAMASRLADGINASNQARLGWQPEANELFVILTDETARALQEKGAEFYPWPSDACPPETAPKEGEALYRLVTSFATKQSDVDQFLSGLK